ncbi:MAG: AglZ/HisF2 family acetamidino modification protein [Gammaproteobacteria bacterium]|nr:AglZ/HisF2 family acetamidino modification protein [Gammaproteobacteria bacterium]
MLRPRIIPCLLVRNKGLVKTVRFGDGKYVGDPINAVRIFNEKKVDELIVLDIDATQDGLDPDYEMIKTLAAECRMPFCYGGGIKNADQAKKIIGLGVEKVALSAAAVEQPQIITEIASELGSQSVIAVLDVRKKRLGRSYEVWTCNGKNNSGKCPVEFAKLLEQFGVGEIVVNSISNDGVMEGYNLAILRQIRDAVSVPLTALGGAGSIADMQAMLAELGVMGAAAGSLFVFKGAYKAVLINYPSEAERKMLYAV